MIPFIGLGIGIKDENQENKSDSNDKNDDNLNLSIEMMPR
jgi:hypothetical protein